MTLQITAQSAIVIAAGSGEELYSKNPEAQLAMASLTKIMTALIAVERAQLPLDDPRRRPLEGWATVGFYPLLIKDDDLLGFALGERVRFGDLLYPMMLRSSPDATRVVAEHVVGRTSSDREEGKSIQSEFVQIMNDRAAKLGLSRTQFKNASGYDQSGHHSSASDLARLARVAMSNPVFAKVVRTTSWTFVSKEPARERTVANDLNPFYRSFPGMTGVKPGSSGDAGVCRVYSAGFLGKSIIAVTLNSDGADDVSRADNHALLDYGFKRLFEIHRKGSGSRDGVNRAPRIRITALAPDRVVTALRDEGSLLTVSGWTVTGDGIVRHVDSDRDESTGSVSEIAIDTMGTDKVATAVRDGDGRLRLMTWSVDPEARVSRLAGQTVGPTGTRICLRNCGLSAWRAVTAMRNSDGALQLISWRLKSDGSWEQIDEYPSSGSDVSHPAEQIELISFARNDDPTLQTFRAVTALTDSANALKLISWDLDESGHITPYLESDSTAGYVGKVSLGYQIAYGKERILAAGRNSSGNLEVTTWRFQDGQIQRLADSGQQAHAASEVCLAGLAPGWLCTGVRTGAGALKLITWRFAAYEEPLKRFIDSGSQGGAISHLAMCQLTGDSYVTFASAEDGTAELTAWKLEAP